jgi:hypothetical protein
MRILAPSPLATGLAIGLAALSLAACSRSERDQTRNDTVAAANDVSNSAAQLGNDVKESAQVIGNDVKGTVQDTGDKLKSVANDPDVKKAQSEVKSALKDLGVSVKKAANETKDDTHDAAEKAAH